MDLQSQINQLREEINTLKNSTTIPFDVGEAFKIRVLEDLSKLKPSTKTAISENETVNIPAVPTSFTKIKQPDGFVEIVLNSSVYYIPYYN